MPDPIIVAGLRIAPVLHDFVEQEALTDLGLDAEHVWNGLASIIERFGPRNAALLARREELQAALDDWWRDPAAPRDAAAHTDFLTRIGYLVPAPAQVQVSPDRLDPEIAHLAGPQLVVPLDNARYALNAANARWGSLHEALYRTDALGPRSGPEAMSETDRHAAARAYVRDVLDQACPIENLGWRDVTGLALQHGALHLRHAGGTATLRDPSCFAGHCGPAENPQSVLLTRHGLRLELVIDPASQHADAAGIVDVRLESALSVIMDCEDSVAAVDAADKVGLYRNWLGLMRGTLHASFTRQGREMRRALEPDRTFTLPDGSPGLLPGRAVLMIRHVGHHMMTDAVLGPDGAPIPETFLDALITSLIALHDFQPNHATPNSRAGSVYAVKPKLHGPDEVELACDLFEAVEDVLGMPPDTLKMGIMDEERRTSVNLAACIAQAARRVVFINTGFLDRTGDEIHSCMQAGPVLPKAQLRAAPWLDAYERRNVAIGLACGMAGNGQIGKGMWAMPDRMGDMLAQKIAHPRAGASTAWVPSPTAATLHALHYLQVDVAAEQAALAAGDDPARQPPGLDALLAAPLATDLPWPAARIRAELDNSCQGLLGYVVRWVDLGIGCSTVPDTEDVGLMEDRATLRISSQLLANWLLHGVVGRDEMEDALARMAVVVDAQNAADPRYRPMAPALDGPAFQAARALVFEGADRPGGYTESVLNHYRRQMRARA